MPARRGSVLDDVGEVLGDAMVAAAAHGRGDLADRLHQAALRLGRSELRVVVAGGFKQGKSSLVNAIVGDDVCPVDAVLATAVPTMVRFGPERRATVALDAGPGPEGEPTLDLREVAVETLAHLALEGGRLDGNEVRAVEVTLDVPLLAGGLVLIDTPAVGGLSSTASASVLAAASGADAVVVVTDASQELTRAEVEFLELARERCPVVVVALSKTDLTPHWRRILELDAAHLGRAGGVPVLPLAAPLRRRALATGDASLDEESGYPGLERLLAELAGSPGARRTAALAAGHVLRVCQQLTDVLSAERTALVAADGGTAALGELAVAQQRADALRAGASRWNQTLADGIVDLLSDLEHELRSRVRQLVKEADAAIERSDPSETWPEFTAWLDSRAGQEGLAVVTALHHRLDQLERQVAAHFLDASEHVRADLVRSGPSGTGPSGAGRVTGLPERLDVERLDPAKQAMVVARGAYGGLAMFSMLFSLAGIALGPVGIGIGLVMGHKGLREEKARRLAQRRAQARNEVRRYCDEFHVALGKELRDTARHTQRRLRDHYAALAEEQQRSVAAALSRATEAAKAERSHRERRLRDLDAELGRLAALTRRTSELLDAAGDRAIGS